MKRVGHLFEQLLDRENIRQAIRKSSKGKRDRKIVQWCLLNEEAAINRIESLLMHNQWIPAQPNVFEKYDANRNKTRTICCPVYFPDQIIHHAIMQVLIPVFMRGMYDHSYGSIPGRGTHRAIKRVAAWLANDPKNTKYCGYFDILKFYKHIMHSTLKTKLFDKIKDMRFLIIVYRLIDSYSEAFDCGIPIGYYSSQWFANFYLEEMDHFIKERLHIKYYVRYADDICLFASSKKKLHRALRSIRAFLAEIGLSFKPNWQVYKVDSRPVDYLGYKIYRNKITIRSKTYLRCARQIRRVKRKTSPTKFDYRSLASRKGIVQHSDCWNLYVDLRSLTESVGKKVGIHASTKRRRARAVYRVRGRRERSRCA